MSILQPKTNFVIRAQPGKSGVGRPRQRCRATRHRGRVPAGDRRRSFPPDRPHNREHTPAGGLFPVPDSGVPGRGGPPRHPRRPSHLDGECRSMRSRHRGLRFYPHLQHAVGQPRCWQLVVHARPGRPVRRDNPVGVQCLRRPRPPSPADGRGPGPRRPRARPRRAYWRPAVRARHDCRPRATTQCPGSRRHEGLVPARLRPRRARPAPGTRPASFPRAARPRGGPGWYSPGCCSRSRRS